MLQSYVHVAINKQNIIIGVKVSSCYDKAPNKYLDYFLIKLRHNKFTLISYPVLLKKRHTKPFERFIDMEHKSDIMTRDIIQTLAEELKHA